MSRQLSFSSENKVGSYFVNPNLGHPVFLDVNLEEEDYLFQFPALLISDLTDIDKIRVNLKENISLTPVLEYKWKLKTYLEKVREERREEKKRIEKDEDLGFWARRRAKKKLKKKEKEEWKVLERYGEKIDKKLKKGGKDYEEKLEKLKLRPFRGDPIKPSITAIKAIGPRKINKVSYLKNEYSSPLQHLIKHDVFGKMSNFYEITLKFSLTEEVINFLQLRNFVMLDLVHSIDKKNKRINYHSIVISKKKWEEYTFVHATDLHLAERNDRIYGILKKWSKIFTKEKKIEELEQEKREIYRKSQGKQKEGFFNKIKNFPSKLFGKNKKNDSKKALEYQQDEIEPVKASIPLEKRLINPNNQFRTFINQMNEKVNNNDLDFVVLTGDIVDFTLLSKLPKDLRKYIDFDYDHSNWKIFKQIILNLPQKKRAGIVDGEELMCPIFTLPGNHDYRPFHYDIRWAGMYRKIGLKLEEAVALNDKTLAFPISSITKSNRALRAYWAEVNPLLDFSIKLGHNNMVFLNSGSDSWKNFRDLVTGHPSVTGLSNRQIKYLENVINNRIKDGENTFLFMHGPPINPKKKRSIFKRIEKKFSNKIGNKIRTKIDEYKESFLKKLNLLEVGARIDGKFNVKYGTVSSNWEKLIKFCKEYAVLTLAGHTHEMKEFRLADPKEGKTKVFDAPPFSLKKVENPAAVYYDLYSEFFTTAEEIEKYGPFVLQTPALGLGGYKNPKLSGAYREVKVKEGKVNSFHVKFINN